MTAESEDSLTVLVVVLQTSLLTHGLLMVDVARLVALTRLLTTIAQQLLAVESVAVAVAVDNKKIMDTYLDKRVPLAV